MKRFLKKHGKKVSVGLLATALMISPMMPIVNAAGDDTCEIRYHYFYMEAENAYITSTYTPKAGATLLTGATKENQVWDPTTGTFDVLSTMPTSIVQNSYTYQYTLHAGLNGVLTSSDTGEVYQLVKKDGTDETKLLKNGNVGMGSGAESYWGLQSKYIPTGVTPTGLTTDDFLASGSGYLNPSNNFTMKSFGEFYNLDVPEGFKFKKVEMTPSWTDEEYKIYFDMYSNALKSAKKSATGVPSTADTYSGGDEDYYFIHFQWTNENTSNGYASGYTKHSYKDSDSSNALSYELNNIDKINVSDTIKKVKAASISVPSTWGTSGLSGDWGHSSATASLEPSITRDYTGIETKLSALASSDSFYGEPTPATSELDNFTVTDKYHWYFMPAMGVVTFEGSGDVCTPATKEENTGVNNEETGVASYAIIGTLLVGAGSAYIYARKNNKFSKL